MTISDDSHDDLPSEHEADVSSQDADALDARLNEIAHSTGRATAWSRFGLNRRFRMRDVANVPGFAQAFHQRVEAAEAADAGFSGLDPTLWEQIMASTHGAVTTPPTSAPSTTKPASGRKRSAARPGVSHPFWSGFANATLAVVVLLAAFGVWRVYDQRQGPPSPPSNETHSLAFLPEGTPSINPTQSPPRSALSTPETNLIPTVTDLGKAAFACDFSRDIPILLEVNEAPIDATVVLLTRSGDVVLSCPEESEPIVLASNKGMVGATEWPGVLSTMDLNYEVGVSPVAYINLTTGKQVEVIPTFSESSTEAPTGGRSQWEVLVGSTGIPGDVNLVDLATMEVGLLSSFFPEGLYPPDLASISSSNGSGVLAVGLRTSHSEDGNGALYHEAGWPGAVLILNGGLDDAHWIPVPDDLTAIQEMVLSPDGEFLALRSTATDFTNGEPPTTVYSVVRTDTGEEIGRSEANHLYSPRMLWAADGDVLVFIDDTGLSYLRTSTGDIGRLLETSDDLQDLRSTYDPFTVLVTNVQAELVATETPDLVRLWIYSFNLQTGGSVMIDGVDISQNLSPWEQDTRFMVMSDQYPVGFGPHTFRVVDPVTRQELGVLEDVEFDGITADAEWALLDLMEVATTQDGMVEVLSFSAQHIYLLRQNEDGPEIVHLPTPDADIISGVAITLSPDGRWLSATPKGRHQDQLRYVLDLTDPDGEWHAIPDDYPETGVRNIYFAMGIGD